MDELQNTKGSKGKEVVRLGGGYDEIQPSDINYQEHIARLVTNMVCVLGTESSQWSPEESTTVRKMDTVENTKAD